MQTLICLVAAPLVAVLWHEAAHTVFALAATRGNVIMTVGFGPSAGVKVGRLGLRIGPILLGGYCLHEGGDRPGDRALIAAAGPISSLFLAALAWNLRTVSDPGFAAQLAEDIAVTSAFGAVFTAIPMRYTPTHESDGMAVLRAFFPVAAMSPRWPQPEPRPDRPLRGAFVFALVVLTPIALYVAFWTGVFMLVLFGLVYLAERH